MTQPKISATARGAFRDLMTGSVVGRITQAFQDEGFERNADCHYEDSSSRRTITEEYLSAIDWADPLVYPRVIGAFQRCLSTVRPVGAGEYPGWDTFVGLMDADGWAVNDVGIVTAKDDPLLLAPGAIAKLKDPVALHEQLARLRRAAQANDPAAVIGSAKELIETTAKIVLRERDVTTDPTWSFPALVRESQKSLGLEPGKDHTGPDASQSTKRILGGATNMVLGINELRNAGYGTGHGVSSARVGLHQRHARLCVNAAITWCELMLDTLADERAPWKSASSKRTQD